MAFFNKAKDIKMPKIDFFNNEKKEKSAAASTAAVVAVLMVGVGVVTIIV